MKITERRLRQLIRSVIKESKINEMMGDMHHFDALAGASGHEKSNILRQKVSSWEEAANAMRSTSGRQAIQEYYPGVAAFVIGMAAMLVVGTPALIAGSALGAIGAGVTVAGAIDIMLNAFKDRQLQNKFRADMENQIRNLEQEFFKACRAAGGPSKLFDGISNEREAFRMFLQQSGLMSQQDIDAYVPSRSF
mgnify:FL=1